MNTTSELYNSIFSGIHSFEVKVSIGSTDYGMDVLTSMRSSRSAFGSGSPHLGLAPAGDLTLSLYVDSSSVPRMATIRPYVRAVNDTQQSEWIAKGVYYIDTREADTFSGLLTLHAYDAMLKGEQAYPSTTHIWPYSDLNVVTEIASFLGVTVDAQTSDLMTAGFMIPLPAQYTLREMLQYIAALYGGSFVLTDANTLRLVCLWNRKTEADLTLGSTHRLTESPAFPACTGVRFLLDDEQELFAGDETGYVYEISCPFATQAAPLCDAGSGGSPAHQDAGLRLPPLRRRGRHPGPGRGDRGHHLRLRLAHEPVLLQPRLRLPLRGFCLCPGG